MAGDRERGLPGRAADGDELRAAAAAASRFASSAVANDRASGYFAELAAVGVDALRLRTTHVLLTGAAAAPPSTINRYAIV